MNHVGLLFATVVQVENRPKLYYYDESYTYAAGGNDRMTLPAGFSSAVNDNNTLLYCSTFPAFQNILYGDALAWVYILTTDIYFNWSSFQYIFFFRQLMLESKPVRQVLVSKVVGASLGQPNGSSIHLADDQAEILLSTLNLDVYDVDRSMRRASDALIGMFRLKTGRLTDALWLPIVNPSYPPLAGQYILIPCLYYR